MSEPAAQLTFFVLTRNRRQDLERCLDSIYSQAPLNSEVLVLVNGSTDDSADMLSRLYPNARLIATEENHGCPGGRNMGIAQASHNWVLCVDDDGRLASGAVDAALQAIRAQPSAAIIGGPVVERDHGAVAGRVQRAGLFTGGICLVNKRKFLAAGGYHTDGLRQGEETELAILLHEQGETIWFAPGLRLIHPVDRSPGKRREILRSGTRQMILTGVKFAPLPIILPYVGFRWISFLRAGLRWGDVPAVFLGTVDASKRARSAFSARTPVSWSSLRSVSRTWKSDEPLAASLGDPAA